MEKDFSKVVELYSKLTKVSMEYAETKMIEMATSGCQVCNKESNCVGTLMPYDIKKIDEIIYDKVFINTPHQ